MTDFHQKKSVKYGVGVWVIFIALVSAGFFLKSYVTSQMNIFSDTQGKYQFTYPQNWISNPESKNLLELSDPLSSGGVPATFIVKQDPFPAGESLEKVARGEVLKNAENLSMYRMLSSKDTSISGKPAVVIGYAFVADPQGAILEAERIPVVVRGVKFIIQSADKLYRIDFQAAEGSFDKKRAVFDRMLEGIRL